MASIQPGMIVRYFERDIPNQRTKIKQMSLNNLALNHTQTDLSDKARKRIRKAVNWMVAITKEKWYSPPGSRYMMQVKVVFVTVTLPAAQVHCDKVITKECLNQLLVELRKYHGVKNYVWKAEAQENGNLHYHIAMDSPVDYDKLKDRWNRIIGKLGYIDRFESQHGHRHPNSTDIHKVKDVENIAAYISEYMAKKELRRPMCGKYWGCSQTISRCESIKFVEENEKHDEIEWIKQLKSTEVKQLDYCQLLFNQPENWLSPEIPIISKMYRAYVQLARRDELPSKARKKKVQELISVDETVIEKLVVKQAADTMQQQIIQLSLLESFFSSQQKSMTVKVSGHEYESRYTSQRKDVLTDYHRETQKLHSHSPDYDTGQ